MGQPSSEAIVAWAEGQTTPAKKQRRTADKPAYRRMTDTDRVLILQLDKAGKTQVEIAQQLGFTQSSISEWLAKCRDTTAHATQYLRGQALRMSRNIVGKGRAADHIKALEGINVLAPEQKPGITVQIGIKADKVKLITPTFACSTQQLSEEKQPLSADTGSDNSRLC